MCEAAKNEEIKKMEGAGVRLRTNPKHFLTWSATAANNRIQKMSKTLVTNISKLQMKVEKAIPFQPTGGSREYCSASCESGKSNIESCGGFCNAGSDNNNDNSPDVVNTSKVSKVQRCCNLSNKSEPSDDLVNKVVKHLGDINRYHYDSRIQNARIVQSHPSVSQTHSQGSVANPDKIIQISIESYNMYSAEDVNSRKQTSDKSSSLKIFDVDGKTDVSKKNNNVLEEHSTDLFYDSGTGSANTSISGSSLSSSSVATLPLGSIPWSGATTVSALGSNLNSLSPSVGNQSCPHESRNNNSTCTPQGNKMTVKVNASAATKGKGLPPTQQDSNSTNSGVPITESTDKTSLLIDNNKSNQKRGLSKSGGKNVEICNKKNSVPSKTQKLGSPIASSTPLKIKTLNSQAYPPSKLAVTIFEEEGELRHAPWFQAGIPREIALEVLRNEQIGSFIVRESTTKSGCFALSLRVPNEYQPCGIGIAHYLILKTSRGYKIKGFTKEFSSLSSLITHHSVMSELLPCSLSLDQYRPAKQALRVSRANSSDFMEPEKLIIGTFTDF